MHKSLRVTYVVPALLLVGMAVAQQPATTTTIQTTTPTQTTTQTTQTTGLTKSQMKAQKKQQKQQEKAADQAAQAQKDQANALKHQDKATTAAEKSGTTTPAPVPPQL